MPRSSESSWRRTLRVVASLVDLTSAPGKALAKVPPKLYRNWARAPTLPMHEYARALGSQSPPSAPRTRSITTKIWYSSSSPSIQAPTRRQTTPPGRTGLALPKKDSRKTAVACTATAPRRPSLFNGSLDKMVSAPAAALLMAVMMMEMQAGVPPTRRRMKLPLRSLPEELDPHLRAKATSL